MHHDVEELRDVGLQHEGGDPRPPMLCGFTTRSAPARRSFSSLSSMRARATMNRSGRSERALSVTNRFPASLSSAATSARARTSRPPPAPDLRWRRRPSSGSVAAADAVGSTSTTTSSVFAAVSSSAIDAPDAAPAADDDVSVHCLDLSFHASSPEELAKVALEERFEHHAECVQGGADTDEDEDDREDLADVVERLHLAEADGRDRRHRLVDGVEHRESEDDVANRPEHEDARRASRARVAASASQ